MISTLPWLWWVCASLYAGVSPYPEPRAQEPSWPASPYAYRPGERLSWEEYERLEARYFDPATVGKAAQALAVFNRELERETLPALRALFSDPLSVVAYAGFTHPSERHSGKYRTAKDDGAGLRVVWQRYVPVAGGPGQVRLISAILFYDYDLAARKFRLISESDALRVRVEVKEPVKGRGFVGLSYVLRMDRNFRVRSLAPGVYVRDNGELKDKRFTDTAQPEHCSMCHTSRNLIPLAHLKGAYQNDFALFQGPKDFMKFLRAANLRPSALQAAQEALAHPKRTFLPVGLLDAIRARMAALGDSD
jgi:hypothetical protein